MKYFWMLILAAMLGLAIFGPDPPVSTGRHHNRVAK